MNLTGVVRDGDKKRLMLLGSVTSILSRHPQYANRPVSWVRHRVEDAIAHQQLDLFYYRGMPVGYVSWAYLSEDIIGRILYSDYTLHWTEWYEGDYLWIVDHCMLRHCVEAEIIAQFCQLFAGHRFIYWASQLPECDLVFRLDIAKQRVSSMPAVRFMETISRHHRYRDEGAESLL